MARPSKFKKAYCDQVVEIVGNKGKSLTQFAAAIGVRRSTIYEWKSQFPEFSDALEQAQEMSQAYWEGELVNMMYDKSVNAPLVKLYFANRFRWHNKPVVEELDEAQPTAINIHFVDAKAPVRVTNANGKGLIEEIEPLTH